MAKVKISIRGGGSSSTYISCPSGLSLDKI